MFTTPEEAVKCIKSNDNVFLHSAVAVPLMLVKAMTDRYQELKNVSILEGVIAFSSLSFTLETVTSSSSGTIV